MPRKPKTREELMHEIADLRLRTTEAEDVLRAIRNYEVDAVVVKASQGDQVFALETADDAYRQMVEQMREGAATVTVDGVVLYANQQFAQLMDSPLEALVGEPIAHCLAPADQSRLAALLQDPAGGRLAANLQVRRGGRVPVSFSATRMLVDEDVVVLLLITDLTYQKQADRVSRLLNLATRLSVAVTTTQVAEAIVNVAVQALDANHGFLAVPDPAVTQLTTLHAVGYSEARTRELAVLPIEPGLPATDAVHARELVFIASLEEREARYPQWPPTAGEGAGALIAVPLLLPDRLLGVLQVDYSAPRAFEPDDIDFVLTIAQQCAQALERASLYRELEQRVDTRTAELKTANEQLARANRQLIGEIAERREAQRQVERSREEERTRLARELHDELGSQLTVLKMDASRLLQDPDLPAAPRQRLTDMVAMIETSLQSVRHLSTELRPHMLDDLGLLPALESYLHDFVRWSGVPGRFVSEVERLDLDGEAATACFRIVQEALTNVARHAQATAVTVDVEAAGDCVLLRVSDNGRGMDLDDGAAKGHFGLVGMRERAERLAAQLEIMSAPGQGTTVLLRIPSSPPAPSS